MDELQQILHKFVQSNGCTILPCTLITYAYYFEIYIIKPGVKVTIAYSFLVSIKYRPDKNILHKSRMTSVDILLCTVAYLIRLCVIETMMAYKWLGLYTSVNLTGKESDE